MSPRKSFTDEERQPLLEESNSSREPFEEASSKEKAAFAAGCLLALPTCGALVGAGFALVVCRGLIRSEVVDVADAEDTCTDIYGYSMFAGAVIGMTAFLYGAYRVYMGDWKLAKTSTTFIHETLRLSPPALNNEPEKKVNTAEESEVKNVDKSALPGPEIEVSYVEENMRPIAEVNVEAEKAPEPWYRRLCC